MGYSVINADVLEWAKNYTGPKFHSLLCDPPYHLTSPASTSGSQPMDDVHGRFGRIQNGKSGNKRGGFMGKKWDGGDIAFRSETWAALAEHLYPGAFLIAFSGSRGWHRQAVAMEDAGLVHHPSVFMLGWLTGQGFPKASRVKDSPAFEGHRYGLQCLKPSLEPLLVFQKPYSGRAVDNITSTGAGALNIDGARIGIADGEDLSHKLLKPKGWKNASATNGNVTDDWKKGRWPANFCLQHSESCQIVGQREQKGYTINRFNDGAKPFGGGAGHEYNTTEMGGGTESVWECAEDCAVLKLNEQSGVSKSTGGRAGHTAAYGGGYKQEHYGDESPGLGDVGGASRFFFNSDWNAEVEERLFNSDPVRYQAKAGRKERDAGLGEMPARKMPRLEGDTRPNHQEDGLAFDGKEQTLVHNSHPTVKPIALCKWLATLLLPPDMYAPRRLLIPFSGVGSEMIGAIQAGWEDVTGIEAESEYIPIAEARLKYWSGKMNIKSLPLFDHE